MNSLLIKKKKEKYNFEDFTSSFQNTTAQHWCKQCYFNVTLLVSMW